MKETRGPKCQKECCLFLYVDFIFQPIMMVFFLYVPYLFINKLLRETPSEHSYYAWFQLTMISEKKIKNRQHPF